MCILRLVFLSDMFLFFLLGPLLILFLFSVALSYILGSHISVCLQSKDSRFPFPKFAENFGFRLNFLFVLIESVLISASLFVCFLVNY